jgi:hypothetical protein
MNLLKKLPAFAGLIVLIFTLIKIIFIVKPVRRHNFLKLGDKHHTHLSEKGEAALSGLDGLLPEQLVHRLHNLRHLGLKQRHWSLFCLLNQNLRRKI